jgi:hypothetical protein
MLRQNQNVLKCVTDTCEISLGMVKQVFVETIHSLGPKIKMSYLANKLHLFWLHKILYFKRKHAFRGLYITVIIIIIVVVLFVVVSVSLTLFRIILMFYLVRMC